MTPDEVELSAQAQDDLDGLIAYLLAHNPDAAARLSRDLDAALATLAAKVPRIDGREVILRSGAPCRRWFVHPVVIFYERAPGRLLVQAIHHHARAPITL